MKKWIHAATQEEIDEAWESYDPYQGKTYFVTGGYTVKHTNYPKNAIEYWFKMQKTNPMDCSISCKRLVDALALVEYGAAHPKHIYELSEKYHSPYKPEYIVSECEKKSEDGCKYFHEGEYGDSVHPFGVG